MLQVVCLLLEGLSCLVEHVLLALFELDEFILSSEELLVLRD